jgi:hypothetical protein
LLGEALKAELGRVYANLQAPDPKLRDGKNLIGLWLRFCEGDHFWEKHN